MRHTSQNGSHNAYFNAIKLLQLINSSLPQATPASLFSDFHVLAINLWTNVEGETGHNGKA